MTYRCNGVVVCGDKGSPVIHLRLATPSKNDERILNQVVNYCLDHGVAVVTAKYLPDEMSTPPSRYLYYIIIVIAYPSLHCSLRLTVCSELTEGEIRQAIKVLSEALDTYTTEV